MSRELLQQALDALETVTDYTPCASLQCRAAIAAIRAAIAAPQVELVAWGMLRADGRVLDVICPEEHESHQGEYTVPLYTAPPAPAVPIDGFGGNLDDVFNRPTALQEKANE